MSTLNKSILRLVECPICFNYMSKPIIGCVRGHNMCYSCSLKINLCPTCNRPVVKTNRNYTLEGICDLLEYPCPYVETGCEEFITINGINEHALFCSYRPYTCILGEDNKACEWEGSRFELVAHALEYHEEKVSRLNINSYSWRASSPAHEVNLIETYDEVFLLHRKLVKNGRDKFMMYWTLQYVGKFEDKIQYNYKLHISSDEYEHRSMTFVELSCDDLRTIDEIIGDDFCVVVPLDQLSTYENNHGVVWYEVSIQKI